MNGESESFEILRPARENLTTLIALWDEMGIYEEPRENRLKRAQEMVTSLVQDLIAEEQETKRMVVKRIEDLKRRIRDLVGELGLAPEPGPADVGSMVRQESLLHSRMTQLRDMKQRRVARYEGLVGQQATFSERLGHARAPIPTPSDKLPSEAEVDLLSERVASLNNEVEARLIEVRTLRQSLMDCLLELDLTEPEGLASWSVLADADRFEVACPLSDVALTNLRAVVDRYRRRRDTAEARCSDLLAAIEQMWTRLDVDEQEREMFLSQLPSSRPASLRLLEQEESRLISLKQANMQRFLEECKTELNQWFERCYIPAEEQRRWTEENTDEDVALLLEELETEITRLKKFYEENEAGFNKIIEWNAAFEKLKITERQMQDPSILSNRGGVLLKYEKTKRSTQRQLKLLESALGGFISLRVEGRPALVYIEARRAEYESEKEMAKRQRAEKHSSLLQRELRYGTKPVVTPGKKRVLSTTQRHMNASCAPAAAVETSHHPKLRKLESVAQQFRKKLTACDTPTSRTPQHAASRSAFRTPARSAATPRPISSNTRVSLAKRRQSRSTAQTNDGLRSVPFDIRSLTRTPTARTPKRTNVTSSTTYSEFAQDVHSKARSSTGQSSNSRSSRRTPR